MATLPDPRGPNRLCSIDLRSCAHAPGTNAGTNYSTNLTPWDRSCLPACPIPRHVP
jgi:hypothetical protein